MSDREAISERRDPADRPPGDGSGGADPIAPDPATWQARIGPLADEELSSEARELLAMGTPDGEPRSSTFLGTMVRHPRLYRKWAPFSAWLLMRGELSARSRELAILRTAWLCQAEFEWGQHTEIAVAAGLTVEEVSRVTLGPADDGWAPEDRAVILAVDELHDADIIGPATWSALADQFDERQLIELIFVIGHYHLVAWVQKSLKTPLENGARGLDAHEWIRDRPGAGQAVARWFQGEPSPGQTTSSAIDDLKDTS
jgi:alkylhydroperoxidase family enzyme